MEFLKAGTYLNMCSNFKSDTDIEMLNDFKTGTSLQVWTDFKAGTNLKMCADFKAGTNLKGITDFKLLVLTSNTFNQRRYEDQINIVPDFLHRYVSDDHCWGRQPLLRTRWNAETPLP